MRGGREGESERGKEGRKGGVRRGGGREGRKERERGVEEEHSWVCGSAFFGVEVEAWGFGVSLFIGEFKTRSRN